MMWEESTTSHYVFKRRQCTHHDVSHVLDSVAVICDFTSMEESILQWNYNYLHKHIYVHSFTHWAFFFFNHLTFGHYVSCLIIKLHHSPQETQKPWNKNSDNICGACSVSAMIIHPGLSGHSGLCLLSSHPDFLYPSLLSLSNSLILVTNDTVNRCTNHTEKNWVWIWTQICLVSLAASENSVETIKIYLPMFWISLIFWKPQSNFLIDNRL